MISAHTLSVTRTRKHKRVGRGNGSRGNYAGRGMKGQKARSGVTGLKQKAVKSWLSKIPKKRGFVSPHRPLETVTLGTLAKHYSQGSSVTPFNLQQKGLIKDYRRGVKVIATGEISHALTVKVHRVTARAQQAIVQAGGSIEPVTKSADKTNK